MHTVVFTTAKLPDKDGTPVKQLLKPFIAYAVLRANQGVNRVGMSTAAWPGERPFTIHLCMPERHRAYRYQAGTDGTAAISPVSSMPTCMKRRLMIYPSV